MNSTPKDRVRQQHPKAIVTTGSNGSWVVLAELKGAELGRGSNVSRAWLNASMKLAVEAAPATPTAYVTGSVVQFDGTKLPVYVDALTWQQRNMVKFTPIKRQALALPVKEAEEFAASLTRDGEGFCAVPKSNGIVTGYVVEAKAA